MKTYGIRIKDRGGHWLTRNPCFCCPPKYRRRTTHRLAKKRARREGREECKRWEEA